MTIHIEQEIDEATRDVTVTVTLEKSKAIALLVELEDVVLEDVREDRARTTCVELHERLVEAFSKEGKT
jgi:hypothetical protein